MSARNRLIELSEHVTTLRWLLGALLLLCVVQTGHMLQLSQAQRIYLPPDLSDGAELQVNTVPAPTVYTFAFYIWQQLNRWSQDGETDYSEQIYTLQGFLTPSCIRAITEDMESKRRKGELRERVRSLQSIPGRVYAPERVQQTASNQWLTWIDVHIQETLAHHPVKDVKVRYRLPVVRFDVDREINPWGLAIDCQDNFTPLLLDAQALKNPFDLPERSQ